jgi:hypothetical protein
VVEIKKEAWCNSCTRNSFNCKKSSVSIQSFAFFFVSAHVWLPHSWVVKWLWLYLTEVLLERKIVSEWNIQNGIFFHLSPFRMWKVVENSVIFWWLNQLEISADSELFSFGKIPQNLNCFWVLILIWVPCQVCQNSMLIYVE